MSKSVMSKPQAHLSQVFLPHRPTSSQSTPAQSTSFEFIVTCADGLDQALMMELVGFGVQPTPIRTGRLKFVGGLKELYHICLYSRVASRVLLPLGEYSFKTQMIDGKPVIKEDIAQALYEFASGYDWTQIFDLNKTFAVRVSVDKRLALNQQFATLRVKDAIADSFNERLNARPSVDGKNPQIAIAVSVNEQGAQLALDLSGASLHRRGYRFANTDAPLKESLAAGLLYTCGWHNKKFDALLDPMCGSGTLAIEALLMWLDYPVGLDKATKQFGFYHWQHHDETLWQACVINAQDKFHHNLTKPLPSVMIADGSLDAIKAVHKNIMASPLKVLSDSIVVKHQALSDFGAMLSQVTDNHQVLIITNPPYGERLGDELLIKPLYQGLGAMVQDHLKIKGVLAVLAKHIEEADTLPINDPQTLRCYNGALRVYFRYGAIAHHHNKLIEQFNKKELMVDEIKHGDQSNANQNNANQNNANQSNNQSNIQEFINRLQKNLSQLKKQARKNHVSNLRIYDADLPNFNVVIDLYGDKVHIQEYTPPKTIAIDVAKERFNLAINATRQVLGVNREAIFIKRRTRQSGTEQYHKQANDGKRYIVRENGAYFLVNFTDYLDTGLFIDHRIMRAMIKSTSYNKTVLNLFAYTCTASVQAALGGASAVTSVDLSDNYLTWGKQNFALNGLMMGDHFEFIAADVFEWIKHHTKQYDVIFIDPPTFSNSKKFYGTFDVQRDHVALINRAMNRLSPDGVLFFSNNFSRFVLSDELRQRYDVVETTQKTTGFDFKKGIHQSYEIRHKAGSEASKKQLKTDDAAIYNQKTNAWQESPHQDHKNDFDDACDVSPKHSPKRQNPLSNSPNPPNKNHPKRGHRNANNHNTNNRNAHNRNADSKTSNSPSKNLTQTKKAVGGFVQGFGGKWHKASNEPKGQSAPKTNKTQPNKAQLNKTQSGNSQPNGNQSYNNKSNTNKGNANTNQSDTNKSTKRFFVNPKHNNQSKEREQ